VSVHYIGWLTNGSSFDSSMKGGRPAQFGLNEVIRGWTEGLPGMKVGGIRRLYIPAQFAYGAQSKPGIPANSDLVFEVKLLRLYRSK
jgi:FKBP-type peptidyl-prolyl cis-trans isomerase